MRRTKRRLFQLEDARKLQNWRPANPDCLPEALNLLEIAIRRQLTDDEKPRAIKMINFAVEGSLYIQSGAETTPPDYELRARARINIRLMTKLWERLHNALNGEVVMTCGRYSGEEFFRIMDFLEGCITLNKKREAESQTRNRRYSRWDPKMFLLTECREIIERFAGKRPGKTKDSPLTDFASAVFKYGIGRDESFNRQIRKLAEL